MPSCSIKHVVVKWHTKGSGRFSFIIRLRNPMSKMWLQVVYLEGDQVHLYPKKVAWKWSIPSIGPQKKTVLLLCVCNEEQKREHTLFLRKVWCWFVHCGLFWKMAYTCEWVTWTTKVNSKITVYKMYNLPKNHSFVAYSVNKWICK